MRDPCDIQIKCLQRLIQEIELLYQDSSGEETKSELSVWGDSYEEVNPFSRLRRDCHELGYCDDPLRNIGVKVDIPEFTRHTHPDEFTKLLSTIEQVFDLCDIPEHLKVKVATIGLRKTRHFLVGSCKETTETCSKINGRYVGKDEEINEEQLSSTIASTRSFLGVS